MEGEVKLSEKDIKFHMKVLLNELSRVEAGVGSDETYEEYVMRKKEISDLKDEYFLYSEYLAQEQDKLREQAKSLISDFCWDEYSSEPDFSDLSNIPLAYTTEEKEGSPVDYEIQVSVDLRRFGIKKELDGVIVSECEYDTLTDLIDYELKGMYFDELVSLSDDDWNTFDKKTEKGDMSL